MRPLVLILLVVLSSSTAAAQERVVSVTTGLGNAMGWLGAQAERYFARERLSGFVGLGYTPSIDPGDPSGPTFAAGLRGFTPGLRHRGFLALSVSQIAVESGGLSPRRHYGPALEAGYQYVARGGFTFMVSLGLGYAPAIPEGLDKVHEVLALGFGYTWRR